MFTIYVKGSVKNQRQKRQGKKLNFIHSQLHWEVEVSFHWLQLSCLMQSETIYCRICKIFTGGCSAFIIFVTYVLSLHLILIAISILSSKCKKFLTTQTKDKKKFCNNPLYFELLKKFMFMKYQTKNVLTVFFFFFEE